MRVLALQAKEVDLGAVHSATRAFDPTTFPVGGRAGLGGDGVVSSGVESGGPAKIAIGSSSATTERVDLVVVGAFPGVVA